MLDTSHVLQALALTAFVMVVLVVMYYLAAFILAYALWITLAAAMVAIVAILYSISHQRRS
ncbi:MAG TPA: hypothetical protein VMB73_01470 [Acetobacteraceae bacterium]|jgi:hypothetical protein|nr:hypothetical protein [Acetobacteraceae bacterium]